jgi:hypothetical protein
VEAAAALRKSRSSAGLMEFAIAVSGLVWVVSGHNGENVIRAEGSTSAAAWQAELDQARVVGSAPDWRISARGRE